jgi:hypothetical protein
VRQPGGHDVLPAAVDGGLDALRDEQPAAVGAARHDAQLPVQRRRCLGRAAPRPGRPVLGPQLEPHLAGAGEDPGGVSSPGRASFSVLSVLSVLYLLCGVYNKHKLTIAYRRVRGFVSAYAAAEAASPDM